MPRRPLHQESTAHPALTPPAKPPTEPAEEEAQNHTTSCHLPARPPQEPVSPRKRQEPRAR